MRSLAALGLLLVAGCASPYGGSSALPAVPSNLSTMRQITGRADGLETLQPEPGDIWASEPTAKALRNSPPTQQRRLHAPAPRGEAALSPPPLSHAEGDFWRVPELGPAPPS
ncbi:hypothetical protein [Roseomonas sp. KE2513]|uniref:hypothetical protein n=1 Tax=Roseomonas sp. KE2513 TaxID=2479202 RepID=UPI0018DFF6F7|nr:hypothetical protein [Roseomonas sp. KE2513]